MDYTQFDARQANILADSGTNNNSRSPLDFNSSPKNSGSTIDNGTQDTINTWLQGGSGDLNSIGDTKNNSINGQQINSLVGGTGNQLDSKNGNNQDLLVGGKDTLIVGEQDPLMENSKPVSSASPVALSNYSGNGTKYYVSPDGSNDNPGTVDKPWKSLNYAVSEDSPVKAGDTVLVQPGTYTELVNLEKSGDSQLGHITLKANGDVTLRDPDPVEGGFREGVIQSVGQGYWVIDGFHVENTSWAGISLRDANNMVVQNNSTYNTGSSGIIVMPDSYYQGGEQEVTSKDIKVLNNTVEKANARWKGGGGDNSIYDPLGTQESLSIWGVDGFEVAGNTVKDGTREGIDIKTGSRNGSVHNNFITGQASISGTYQGYQGGPALYIEGNRADMFNIDVYDNVVSGNTADGIVVADEVPSIGEVRDIRVYNNIVSDNGREGMNSGRGIGVTSNVRNVDILNNTVTNNVQAFEVDGSDFTGGYKTKDVLIRNNTFADSSYRNGSLEDVSNLTLDGNTFTDEFERLYDGGTGLDNFVNTNNKTVSSI
ncbi:MULTISPECIES: right-handed parallel beta-helix repeat-containing protein [Nostocales]|uniref:Right-handed parallel beta-helix repeat-containing protein n=2 Tax=Nostocales TaxID=1161 RepID=A0ABW8WRW6_9CYAN|nr:right-handed parallel beta-helix repeat-containing protein [Tolypothrix bouteillei]